MVQVFNHGVITPRDPQSGNPTGTRIHQPFTFTCSLNKAVPLMYNALVTGELLATVELKWYRTQASEQVHFFTTQLEEGVESGRGPPRTLTPKFHHNSEGLPLALT